MLSATSKRARNIARNLMQPIAAFSIASRFPSNRAYWNFTGYIPTAFQRIFPTHLSGLNVRPFGVLAIRPALAFG